MKLPSILKSKSLLGRLKLFASTVAMRGQPPTILAVLLHRPEFFGRSAARYVHALLRAPGDWTVGERELFASYVAKLNNCKYCLTVHGAIAAKLPQSPALEALPAPKAPSDSLRRIEVAASEPRVAAALDMLRAVLRQGTTPAHVQALLREGVSPDGIELLVHIAVAFTVINRVADSLQLEVPRPTELDRLATLIANHGYVLAT